MNSRARRTTSLAAILTAGALLLTAAPGVSAVRPKSSPVEVLTKRLKAVSKQLAALRAQVARLSAVGPAGAPGRDGVGLSSYGQQGAAITLPGAGTPVLITATVLADAPPFNSVSFGPVVTPARRGIVLVASARALADGDATCALQRQLTSFNGAVGDWTTLAVSAAVADGPTRYISLSAPDLTFTQDSDGSNSFAFRLLCRSGAIGVTVTSANIGVVAVSSI
jgi:hypothetical protein